MTYSVGFGCEKDAICGWYLPDMPGDLHTGFVMAFGGCVALLRMQRGFGSVRNAFVGLTLVAGFCRYRVV